MKSILIAAAIVITAIGSLPLTAQNTRATVSTQSQPIRLPPETYAGQYWTLPSGCTYSRTGRPGEIVWYILQHTRKAGCPTYIVQKSFGDVY